MKEKFRAEKIVMKTAEKRLAELSSYVLMIAAMKFPIQENIQKEIIKDAIRLMVKS